MSSGRVTVCCGMDRQSLDLLFVLSLWARQWFHPYLDLKRKSPAFITKFFETRYRGFVYIVSLSHALTGFLLGAGIGVSPDSPYSVLIQVENHQCENPRNKLYGILGLVDWSNGPVPVPDYNKDIFELIKDVFDILLVWKLHQTSNYPSSLLTVARALLYTVSVDLQHDSLRNAVASRNDPGPGASPSYKQFEYLRYADVSWRGMKLSMPPRRTNASPNGSLYVPHNT
jgi:hypothetical protein